MRLRPATGIILSGLLFCAGVAQGAGELPVGVAQVDITPDYPVRLSGFGFRRAESEGVTERIWAKALAFGDAKEGPAILITTDNLGVSDLICQEVAGRLAAKVGLKRERLTVTATHTHTAPMLSGVAPTLFGTPIPEEHQARIDRYTREFTDKLEAVALEAVRDIRPCRLQWAIGSVGFAVNRRTAGGPVDHDLPILIVRERDGTPRAIYWSYACHCVTLSHNEISGDWAGYAMEEIQAQNPGVLALASVGCGADSNPSSGVTGDKIDMAREQGRQVAKEVKGLMEAPCKAITERPLIKWDRIDLELADPRGRAEWEERAKRQDAVGYHARVNLARLDAGQKPLEKISYPAQSWLFGDQLAMIFLAGEVVVDYSLRLKREFDRERLWVNAYANDAPCYIPSERVLQEGGYEGADAMIYYDKPQKFAPGLENKIIGVLHRQLPESYLAQPGTEGSRPKSPEESRLCIQTKAGLEVELVAAEPLIRSPVAIDWGPDGRLWVCEMYDYPTGADGDWAPGGRVSCLKDTDGDGRYDESRVFLDHIPFPTGVTVWGRGALVCAAPDILYAEDLNEDGRADRVEKLFTGFYTENYQARVNSLCIGLDNWIYGANGLLGGVISSAAGETDIRGHDFRFRRFQGPLETVSGLTQQGRARDDWGNWYGCNNGSALLFYPTEQRYFIRNAHIPAPAAVIIPEGDFDVGRVYPISRLLERFNDPEAANRLTSACGLGIYRDDWLGEEFFGNTFTCEPVHNLVHRLILEGSARRRPSDEQRSEFLASTDNWFRPVQARTGPNGGLYVVDMYRFLIEHPRWIPAERLARIDVRAGADLGRIYRVGKAGKQSRPTRDLTRLGIEELANALETMNGTERDRAHVELLHRRDPAAAPFLKVLLDRAGLPQVRAQALSVLEGIGALEETALTRAFRDPDDRVRAHAVRLSEGQKTPPLTSWLSLTKDPSARVREQVGLTLGESSDARARAALVELAKGHMSDARLRSAVLSSAAGNSTALLRAVLKVDAAPADRAAWVAPLVATVVGGGDDEALSASLRALLMESGLPEPEQFPVFAQLLGALDRPGRSWPAFFSNHPEMRDVKERMDLLVKEAPKIAIDGPEQARPAAILLLGCGGDDKEAVALLCDLLRTETSPPVRAAALSALRRQRGEAPARLLLEDWERLSPLGRKEGLELLLQREEWTRLLLGAIQLGKVPPGEVSLDERARLAESGNEEVRRQVAEIWAGAPSRLEALERYQACLTLAGNPANGKEVFAKSCASCHALDGIGHAVGADLEPLRVKEAAYFLQNILDPNGVVEPRYVNYELETKDDRVLSGIIGEETATSLTIISAGGVTETILRSAISNLRALKLSLMPEGLEEGMDPQSMADLIAFLRSNAEKLLQP